MIDLLLDLSLDLSLALSSRALRAAARSASRSSSSESLASLEYTLTASDKEELLKAYAAKAAEQGADVKFTAAMAPDKLTLG